MMGRDIIKNSPTHQIIQVKLGKKSYPIFIGFDLLDKTGDYAKELGNSCFIISQPKIFSLYGERLKESLKKNGISVKEALIGEGERHKSFFSLKNILKEIISFDSGRKRLFIANLGGGIVGDVGGFVAAIYKRGIDYINIPTTLLANVDSGIGGKTGVNFMGIKNIIGSFHQPSLVISDLSLLKTLPREEIIGSMAEVVKYGVIKNPRFFRYIEKNVDEILSLKSPYIEYIVSMCYKIKARVVQQDEFDKKGIRAILNYGHTIGHSLEAGGGLVKRHGDAISIGMVAINRLAVKLGFLKEKEGIRIKNLLLRIGLPVKIKPCDIDKIMSPLLHDKKFTGKIRLVIPERIGRVRLAERMDEKEIILALKEIMNFEC
ncbi:MAG: 3-dehydroquinate synthase [bacterium]